jgi:hypothetical protein
VVRLQEVAEPSVVVGGAVGRVRVVVVVVRPAEVVGAPVAVGSGAEVAAEVADADVVAGTDAVGCEGSAGREPSGLLVVPTGAGLTST